MWRWKPYGEVTLRFAQDANVSGSYGGGWLAGCVFVRLVSVLLACACWARRTACMGPCLTLLLPAACCPAVSCMHACRVRREVMQDPRQDPHGTKWMAPGPLGQCHPLPETPTSNWEMMRPARTTGPSTSSTTLTGTQSPAVLMLSSTRASGAARERQGKQAMRIAGALEEVEAQLEAEQRAAAAAGAGAAAQPVATIAEAAAAAAPTSSSSEGFTWPWQPRQQQEQRQQLAATSRSSSSSAAFGSLSMAAVSGGGVEAPGPMASCSLSLDVGRASKAVLHTMARAARRAPSLQVNSGRPRLSRPTTTTAAAAAAAGAGVAARGSRKGGSRRQQS